jgi:hypothetical protein
MAALARNSIRAPQVHAAMVWRHLRSVCQLNAIELAPLLTRSACRGGYLDRASSRPQPSAISATRIV